MLNTLDIRTWASNRASREGWSAVSVSSKNRLQSAIVAAYVWALYKNPYNLFVLLKKQSEHAEASVPLPGWLPCPRNCAPCSFRTPKGFVRAHGHPWSTRFFHNVAVTLLSCIGRLWEEKAASVNRVEWSDKSLMKLPQKIRKDGGSKGKPKSGFLEVEKLHRGKFVHPFKN